MTSNCLLETHTTPAPARSMIRSVARSMICAVTVSLAGLACVAPAAAQSLVGTDIAYARSGMRISGSIIDGTYDFTFRLFDAPTGGNLIGSAITITGVHVNAGKLPTQTLDFGDDAFNGDARWIDVRGRPNGGTYKTVGPRTEMLAVPYALALPFLRTIDAPNSPNIIGGDPTNSVNGDDWGQTVCGGGIGGDPNATTTYFASVVGGLSNTSSGYAAFTGGGTGNVSGGGNTAVPGGYFNTATGNAATIGGGSTNVASGTASTVPGGKSNAATGNYSFASGFRGKATHLGSFVWADHTEADFNSFTTNSFNVRASGGYFFYSNAALTSGAVMAPGDGSWSALSDRNAKENLEAIDGRDVLQRLAEIPVSTWNYKSQDASIRHIGPMAQDFKAAFGVGGDEHRITTVDADGVLFAAVQGLHQESRHNASEIDRQNADLHDLQETLAARDTLIAEQALQISDLGDRLARLERMVEQMARP